MENYQVVCDYAEVNKLILKSRKNTRVQIYFKCSNQNCLYLFKAVQISATKKYITFVNQAHNHNNDNNQTNSNNNLSNLTPVLRSGINKSLPPKQLNLITPPEEVQQVKFF